MYILEVRGSNSSFNNNIDGIAKVSEPSFKGFSYNPKKGLTLSRLNPINFYTEKSIRTFIKVARHKVSPIIDSIKPYLKRIGIEPAKNRYTFGWDINPGNRKKYILFLHGLTQNVSNLQSAYETIIKKSKFAIFAPEYRGFGENLKSKITSKTLFEDAAAGYKYLVKKRGVKPENIYILGHSMGGAVASHLAAKKSDIKGLILVSSVSSLKMALNQSRINSIPNLVWFMLEKLKFLSSSVDKFVATSTYIPKIKIPIDIIHSANDNFIKAKSSILISQKCKNLKSISILPYGGHRLEEEKIGKILECLKK